MAEKVIKTVIQLRRGTEAKWAEIGGTFVPKAGEPCLTLDGENAGKVKYGDGINTWSNLSYSNCGNRELGSEIVNINKYGIKSIDFAHKPPYSLEEYEIAYNNMEGFKKALEEMSERGITNIIFPKGYYPMCYRCDLTGYPHFSHPVNWCIRIPSYTTVDLNGSTIKIIFDSENKNPYDKSSNVPAKLVGMVFKFDKTYNSVIKNGKIIGDRYDRAYISSTLDNDKKAEQSYAIKITNGSVRGKIENMTLCGFMGDGITSDGNNDSDLGTIETLTTFYPGYVNSNGEYLTDVAGKYTTDFMDCSDLKTNEVVLRTNIGYTYIPDFANQLFEVVCYDENKNYLTTIQSEHLESIILKGGTKYIRIILSNEEEGLETISKIFQITTTPSAYFDIYNVEIFDCNRGGISNLPLDTIVQKCHLYYNGMANQVGWQLFPDTTRYAINCEDTVTRTLIIKNNYIHNCFNVLLVSAKYLFVDNNVFEDCTSSIVSLYNSINCIISNNIVRRGSSIVSCTDYGDKTVIVKDNLMERCGNIIGNVYNHKIIIDGNIIEGFVGLKIEGDNIKVTNNTFYSDADNRNLYHSYLINAKFSNNEFRIKHLEFSTSPCILNLDKFSYDNLIDVSQKKTCIPAYVCNSELYIGRASVASDTNYRELIIINCNVYGFDFIISHYGTSSSEPMNILLKNCNFSDFKQINFSTNVANTEDKIANEYLEISDCNISIETWTSNAIIEIGGQFVGDNQVIKIKLKNVSIINKTGQSINLLSQPNSSKDNIFIELENCTFENVIDNSTDYIS